jgi:translation initiation factor IF-2
LQLHRQQIMREQGMRTKKHITLDEIGRRLALGNFKELNLIIKGDVDGSVEALSDSLQKLSTDEIHVTVVSQSRRCKLPKAMCFWQQLRMPLLLGSKFVLLCKRLKLLKHENIEIRTYSIIYDAIDEIKAAMEGMLEPKIEKRAICNIEIKEVFKITGVGTIAGCMVLDGKMKRDS